MIGTVRWGALLVASVLPLVAHASGEGEGPLHFDEVLRSVNAHDPRIREAVERVRGAEGSTTAARGAFDPRLEGDGKLRTGAYYDIRSGNVELRQPTSVWGSELFVGYRIGLDLNKRWPTYLENQTLSSGEVRAGIEVPIWRGGLIDPERAERSRALHNEDAANHALSVTKLDLELAAAQAYWTWVSAGQNREVAAALLYLADERDAQLRGRLKAGSIAEFDVLDNERILLERRAWMVAAQRSFEEAAFELSLFLRSSNGVSVVPDPARLPRHLEIEPLAEPSVERAIDQVLECHPELERARAELEAAEVGLALTRNQVAPELRGRFAYSRDLGDLTGTPLDFTLPGNVFEAGVELSMPLLLRRERGRQGVARAAVGEKEARLRFVADRLRANTRDAASAVRAAEERVMLTAAAVDTAARLAEGERRRFEAGSSNLIFVNLREQQAAMATMQHIEALALAEIERTRWETTTRVQCGLDSP
ncbi:MAG: TolC family protein [Polyangiales bacterium]